MIVMRQTLQRPLALTALAVILSTCQTAHHAPVARKAAIVPAAPAIIREESPAPPTPSGSSGAG